jgi:hypothetical protein
MFCGYLFVHRLVLAVCAISVAACSSASRGDSNDPIYERAANIVFFDKTVQRSTPWITPFSVRYLNQSIEECQNNHYISLFESIIGKSTWSIMSAPTDNSVEQNTIIDLKLDRYRQWISAKYRPDLFYTDGWCERKHGLEKKMREEGRGFGEIPKGDYSYEAIFILFSVFRSPLKPLDLGALHGQPMLRTSDVVEREEACQIGVWGPRKGYPRGMVMVNYGTSSQDSVARPSINMIGCAARAATAAMGIYGPLRQLSRDIVLKSAPETYAIMREDLFDRSRICRADRPVHLLKEAPLYAWLLSLPEHNAAAPAKERRGQGVPINLSGYDREGLINALRSSPLSAQQMKKAIRDYRTWDNLECRQVPHNEGMK